jgi:hypothetical protein
MGKFLLILLMWAGTAQAVELRELSVFYKYFNNRSRDPFLYDSTPKEGLDLNFNVDLVGPFYWNNTVSAMTDDAQYKSVYWNFHVGFRLFPSLAVEFEHLSRHLLDDRYPYMKFPVQNSLGFHWTIFQLDKPEPALFR